MIEFERVQAVSWDVDGTLYELPQMKRELQRMVLRQGVRAPLRVIREQRALARLRRAMKSVREAGGDLTRLELRDDRGWLVELEERWYVEAIRRAGARPGVRQALDRFAGQGLRQVVLSDYAAASKLSALGLRARFEHSFAGEAIGALKPSPRAFQAVLDYLELDASALLHIGDRGDTDGAAARLGCQVLLLDPEGSVSAALERP